MSTLPRRRLTPEEYLAWERQADTRHEYYRGEAFAMAGASTAHNRIKEKLSIRVGTQLEGGPCWAVTSDQRVVVRATGLYTYPDMVIVCGEAQFADDVRDTLSNPHALVEILSDSTEKYDRGTKFSHYRQIPSLKEYILVAQNEPLVERYVRQADGSWSLTDFVGLDKTFAFATLPVRIPLADIYREVVFPAKAPEPLNDVSVLPAPPPDLAE